MATGAVSDDWRDETQLAMNPQPSALGDLRLMPAPVDRFRRPPTQTCMRMSIRSDASPAADGGAVQRPVTEVPLPFFWYDPPWQQASLDRCRFVADLVGQSGVTIAALQSDLCCDEGGLDGVFWPRLAPHRCDRAGWSLADAQTATVIEVRLGMNRDDTGGYVYSAAQLARWHGGEDPSLPSNGQPWIPLLFPPEWADLSQLGSKVSQLRCLGEAAVFVSCDEANVKEVLPAACAGGVDGVILRCQDDPVSVLQRSRDILDASQTSCRPRIWLAGGELGAQDAVKCLALGASAVSIDWMCNPWLLGDAGEQLTGAQRAAISLGVNVGLTMEDRLQSKIRKEIEVWCEQVAGILQSLLIADVGQLHSGHLRDIRR